MQRSEISNALLLTHLDHLTHFLRSCINFAPSLGAMMLDGRKLITNYSMIGNEISLQRIIFVATRKMKEEKKNTKKRRHRLCDERFFILCSFLSKQKHMMNDLFPLFSVTLCVRFNSIPSSFAFVHVLEHHFEYNMWKW